MLIFSYREWDFGAAVSASSASGDMADMGFVVAGLLSEVDRFPLLLNGFESAQILLNGFLFAFRLPFHFEHGLEIL